MRGKRAKQEYFGNGFQIRKLSSRYRTKRGHLRAIFKNLTPLEMIVYAASKVSSLREIAGILKRSYTSIRKIYKRAKSKVSNNKVKQGAPD